VTPERIYAIVDAEVEELHVRYKTRLGAAMSKSLGSPAYVCECGGINASTLPRSRQPEFVADLEQEPFVAMLFRVPAVSYTTVTADHRGNYGQAL